MAIAPNIKSRLKMFRPKQWVKQILVVLPVLSVANEVSQSDILSISIASFSFTLIASAVYIYNDLCDVDIDKNDPVKKSRPIPSGEISVKEARTWYFSLQFIAIIMMCRLDNFIQLLAISIFYVAINILYSKLRLKRVRLLGLTIIAIGFPIRFIFGTIAINLPISYWAFVLLMQLALLLLSGKRFQVTKRVMDENRLLKLDYDRDFYLLALIIFSATFGASYSGFISDEQIQALWGKPFVLLSIIPVVLGLTRYLEIVTHPNQYREYDATESVIRDWPTIIIAVIYIFLMAIGRVSSAG